MDSFFTWVSGTFSGLSLSSQMLFLFVVAVCLAYLAFKASHREENALDWVDFITDQNGKLSASKLSQMIGLIISSWVVVVLADKGSISFDIFGLYLAFAAGTAGWSSYLKAKFAGSSNFNVDGNAPKPVDELEDEEDSQPKPPSAHAGADLTKK